MTAHSHYIPVNNRTKMVTVTVRTTGKPVIQLDFPDKHPDQVTVGELKKGIQAKFPQVRRVASASPFESSSQLTRELSCSFISIVSVLPSDRPTPTLN
jgi:hypothetical protein